MNTNSIFKKTFYKQSLVIRKNGLIPKQWSNNPLCIINDTDGETNVGVVCNDQYVKNSNQPFSSTGDIYDPELVLSLYTSSQQSPNQAFYRLDPVRICSPNDKDFLAAFLFRTLFKYDSDGILTPDLALDYGIHNELFTEWTFQIKKKCYYENGKHILPSHIAYGISRRFAVEHIVNLQNESLYYPFFYLDIKTDNNGLLYKGPYDRTLGYRKRQELFNNAVIYDDDKMTITYKLNKSVYDFRDMLTWFCLSTPIPIDFCLSDGSDIDFKPISSGPYKINTTLSEYYKTDDIHQKPRKYLK
jgi:ABC-type transport system substrate-binding protein